MACNCANEEVSKKILEMMKESGAHLQGHFKLTSGLHSDNYMQCALMLRFPHPGARRFALVEDVCTTGKSSRESAQILVDGGAEWVGSGCIVDRRAPECLPDWDLKSLVKVCFATYKPEECPLCAEGLPLVKPGSRPDGK